MADKPNKPIVENHGWSSFMATDTPSPQASGGFTDKMLAGEYEAALRRAFSEKGADYIVLDVSSSDFLRNGVEYGRSMGWLSAPEAIEGGAERVPLTEYGHVRFPRRIKGDGQ